jgi:hypothetical protein
VVPEVSGNFQLVVEGVQDRCRRVCLPILIDDIVRPEGHEGHIPIGSLRQGAWRLPDEIADRLVERLMHEAPDVYAQVFG